MVCGCRLNKGIELSDTEKERILKKELKKLQGKKLNKTVILGEDNRFHEKGEE